MRIAIAGFSHETNTFSNVLASYERFAESGILRGAEIIQQHRYAHSTITGFLKAADVFGFEAVPLIHAQTDPCGMITKDAFDRLVGEMLRLLEEQGPWDGVLLANHGAAVSEEYHDADGEIARRVRALVGSDVPIGMGLDLHANFTQRTIDDTTACVFYRQNPHVDARERGFECAEIIHRTIKGEVRPVQALETPPLVVNIVKQFTGAEPLASLMRDCETVIARPGMLSASVIQGYPYADVPEMGMSFLAVHDGDDQAAREAARWLARRAWDRRAELQGDIPLPTEALKHAMRAPKGPVVLMDVGDNIGGGSPGDSTILLAEAKQLGVRSYLQTLYDPEPVQACVAAGVGNDVTLRVGAKTDDRHGQPVEVTGRVRLISDGKFEDPEPTHGGARYFDGGTTVVLETTGDHTLVLTSRRIGNTSIQQMYSLGIRPEEKKVVVAKGVQSPRPAYEPIAAEIVLVNTPGVTTSDLSWFTYENRRRPLYPFEPETTW
ncbi:MAG TPA: M81 family metallopeptidase [Thermomicrobiales bacterium]|nr:M81 family metallopeptidase [Thermomicrobiales bacterium]